LQAAWQEYFARVLQRDGVVTGHYAWSHTWIMALVGTLWLGGIAIWNQWAADPHKYAPDFVLSAQRDAVLCIIVSPCLAVLAAGLFLRERRLSRLWKKWELRQTGLTVWQGGDARELLPRPGDLVVPGAARIAGNTVPIRRLRGWQSVGELMLALGERRGSTVRAYGTGSVLAVAGFLLVAALWAWNTLTLLRFWPLTVGACCLCLLTPIALHLSSARDLRQSLIHGRAMLERLGW
jgi:hypothetical protein